MEKGNQSGKGEKLGLGLYWRFSYCYCVVYGCSLGFVDVVDTGQGL